MWDSTGRALHPRGAGVLRGDGKSLCAPRYRSTLSASVSGVDGHAAQDRGNVAGVRESG